MSIRSTGDFIVSESDPLYGAIIKLLEESLDVVTKIVALAPVVERVAASHQDSDGIKWTNALVDGHLGVDQDRVEFQFHLSLKQIGGEWRVHQTATLSLPDCFSTVTLYPDHTGELTFNPKDYKNDPRGPEFIKHRLEQVAA
jgi:hypothetical protein